VLPDGDIRSKHRLDYGMRYPRSNKTNDLTSKTTADPVQDLYLRELRAYKPKPAKAGEAEAHVQKFTAPKPPPSPEESSLAGDLQAYETQAVEVEGQAVAGEEAPKEESWFEEDEEEAHPAAH
jgi:F-type H+-transporting ATPase subunit h